MPGYTAVGTFARLPPRVISMPGYTAVGVSQ
jgi:hypothetical protein